MNIGEIILTNDIQAQIDEITSNTSNSRIFFKSDFSIDDAKMAIEESFVSSNTMKHIILAGDKFNIYAQNALLKILEEPPYNTHFTLITKSKNAILPTIISRMIVRNKKTKTIIKDFEIPLENLTLEAIMKFVNKLNNVNVKREEIKEYIESLLFSVKKANIVLNSDELDYFNRAILQLESYENPKYILLQLLLMILEHKRKYSRRKHNVY